ncbi:carbon-nitrogen hydrolase family protein [Thiospirillum jenense]|uniref:Carbon-nitrogen hydrolase family protein n=1 Tax=Thiospirillum jenense TaxID=1653858 RepID=A0A839HM11_9GAMM|nr:carbon-nitrogen hydrolase family protein [Thiospirillum jenense]MBB1127417.1 carbon-nitrogen hydrolase family protein [Thiospirillum jenense]
MNEKPRVAAIQMASCPNVNANLIEAERLICAAVEAGANLVVLPENFAFMGKLSGDQSNVAEIEHDGPLQLFLSRLAVRYGIWLVGGTIPIRIESDSKRVRAACLVFDQRGECVGRYDKIHLFDVSLPGVNERYHESASIAPGNRVLTIDSPFGRLGIAVCYDLRFPELFRQLIAQQVDIFTVPAAFTALTGKAHWEVLVRARAIENLAYVIAAAQGGYHLNGRETYGHSLIVDPWGAVLAEVARGTGFICAEVDRSFQDSVRRTFPVLQHRRLECG